MTLEIAFVLALLAAALVLFVTEWVRMDAVALLVLAVLSVTRLVSPSEALSGFSNPAVVTVWAMFMISAALTRTGAVDRVGGQILRLAGTGEARLVAVIMIVAGALSAVMNNIGVSALMLPAVVDVARRSGRSPSRLLMPLAYGSLLGGLTTLIGTPPNLLVSAALGEAGLDPFGLFDFTPVGGAVLLAGVAFVALVGRRLLPAGELAETATGRANLPEQYGLNERAVVLRVGPGSPLAGRTLGESRLGSAARLGVMAVIRDTRTVPAPPPRLRLQQGDRLLVGGKLDRFHELRGWRELVVEERELGLEALVSPETGLGVLTVRPGSKLVGRTVGQAGFRQAVGVIVLALKREAALLHASIADTPLEAGDRMLVQAVRARLADIAREGDVAVAPAEAGPGLAREWGLAHRIFSVRVPAGSVLAARSLAESRLGEALRLGVLGITRGDATRLMPDAADALAEGDRLILRGEPEDLDVLRGLQGLEIESDRPHELDELESEQYGFVEAVLSPRSGVVGKTLRELAFRERHGLIVLAILREGQARRSGLRDIPLQFGDALLLFGARDDLLLLGRDPDFLVLTRAAEPPPRRKRAPVAGLILAAVLAPVLAGWMPISIAAVVGATLMVLAGCLTMEEAYRAVEWRAIFLIAGMLPLGIAMERSGAASLIAEGLLGLAAPLGPWGMLVGLYVMTALATSVIPTAALVVLMAPIALRACAEMSLSPHAIMMAVAVAASASFTSPISHPANVLVMGPGGYRFKDYVKLGAPLTLVVLAVVLVVLPWIWPLRP